MSEKVLTLVPRVGRPTDYKPEYCGMLVEHMGRGMSFESFAFICKCNRATLYNWCDEHVQFLDAKSKAIEANRFFWELLMVQGGGGNLPGYNATTAIFNMKNRFPLDWKDRTEVEQTGNIEHSLKLSPDDRKDLIKALLDEREQKKI